MGDYEDLYELYSKYGMVEQARDILIKCIPYIGLNVEMNVYSIIHE